jgi:hypothetical protein
MPKTQANPSATITIRQAIEAHVAVTTVEINEAVLAYTEDRFLCVHGGGKEVKIGPLTVAHASALAEDLGYDSLA